LTLLYNGYQSQFNFQPFTVEQCPPKNKAFVTVVPGGRLGNGLFECLSTWALAKQMDAVPVVPMEIFKQISVAFGDLKIPALEDVAYTCNLCSQKGNY